MQSLNDYLVIKPNSLLDNLFIRQGQSIAGGDFEYLEFPRETIPRKLEREAIPLDEYQEQANAELASNPQIMKIWRDQDNLDDPENFKLVFSIWSQQYEQVRSILEQITSEIAVLSQQLELDPFNNELALQKQNLLMKGRGNFQRARHIIDGMYKGAISANTKLLEINNIIWYIGQDIGNDLFNTGMRWRNKFRKKDVNLKDPEQLLSKAQEAWMKMVEVLKTKHNPFIARFGQFLPSVGDMEWLFGEFGTAYYELLLYIDKSYQQISQLYSSTVSMPMSAAASAKRFAQVNSPFKDPFADFEQYYNQSQSPQSPFSEPMAELSKLPIDDDEYIKLLVPQVKNTPKTNLSRVLFAGQNLYLIEIVYTKTASMEEGVTSSYVIEPYSFREKLSRKHGPNTTFLFGWDIRDNHIKNFAWPSVSAVRILPEQFSPRYEVELQWLSGETI